MLALSNKHNDTNTVEHNNDNTIIHNNENTMGNMTVKIP